MRKLKSIGIRVVLQLMDWNDHLYSDAPDINWRDHLRWWIERILSRAFARLYAGSDEELADTWDTPLEYMSNRQLDYFLNHTQP